MDLLVLLVEADQKRIRKVAVLSQELRLDLLKRCEIPGLLRFRVGSVEAPVFVAASVLQIDYVLVVLSPEVDADATLAVLRYGVIVLAPNGGVHRPRMDVQNAVHWSKVGESFAVRGEARLGLLRVTEENFPRDQGGQGGFELCHLFLSLSSV